ncbi:MAG TPA: DUF2892 domain-containing protein [Asticcacaulis sp.]|nr:DUF2892 domain-containing protein [Asticcacaulis sp.]
MLAINLPAFERLLRVVTGSAIMICAWLLITDWPKWLAVGTGAFILLTGVIGFCPMCALAGRRLAKRSKGCE